MNNLFLSPTDGLRRAMEVIDAGRLGMALVVDTDGRLLGTLTDGDVRRHLLGGGGRDESVEKLYCRKPLTATTGYDRAGLARIARERGIKLIPFIEDGRPTRLLTPDDRSGKDRPAILGGAPAFREPIPVARPTLPKFGEISDELERVLASGIITNGPQVEAFEREAAEWMGTEPEKVVAVSSCTTGLVLALSRIEAPGEVVMPSFTYFATGLAATWNALTPVFVDARPDDFNVDAGAVERAVVDKTNGVPNGAPLAIVGVYVFGCPPPVVELRKLADAHGIPLILDAAHAFGAGQDGTPAGRFGDIEVFSLSPTKPVTSGEGGLIVCREEATAADLRRRRNLGLLDSATDPTRGLNGRMSEFNAVLGRASLRHLEENLQTRHRLVQVYRDELGDTPGLGFQKLPSGAVSTFKDLALVVDSDTLGMTRDDLAEGLAAENIGTKKYFSPPLHLQRRFAGLSRTQGPLKVTEKLADGVLCLPLYSHQEEEDVRRVAAALKRLVAHGEEVNRRLTELRREWE
ncbi:MAG TPA: aminotransferase class I/II-fold pyridoxal phosphate-dependent enzyme [bacterium]|nr:aminotransferase class I/II-fold pyridoxal phosphate-dependent enzyme [bacterium]